MSKDGLGPLVHIDGKFTASSYSFMLQDTMLHMCWMDSSAMAVPFSRWTKAPGAWLVRRPTCLRTMVRARCYGFRMARTQAPCAGMHEVGSVQTQLVQGNGGRALEHYCEEWDLL